MSLAKALSEHGYAIVNDVLDQATVDSLRSLVDAARAQSNQANVSNSSGTYGLRNLTDVIPEVAELVRLPAVVNLVESTLGPQAFMTRATLFDKTPGANWGVFWHQDLSIAVQDRHEVDGFSSWTRKAGVHCVQPPVAVMEQVLAVRLHLDDCTDENGALRVLPGTHRLNRMASADIEDTQKHTPEVVCDVRAGGAVLMRPLLLHASSPMKTETCRRVIHFEFTAQTLPAPLQWNYSIPCRTENYPLSAVTGRS